MTQRFADVLPRPADDVPADAAVKEASPRAIDAVATEKPLSDPATAWAKQAENRRMLTHKLGIEVAKGLGWHPGDHTERELAALGEHLILDHALHGDEASGTHMLIAVAKAAGALDPAAVAQGDHDRVAGQVADFLQAEFKDELAVSHTASRLAKLRMPSRRALAKEYLEKLNVDGERRAYRPDVYAGSAILTGKRIQDAPATYYVDADTLSADDVQRMTQRTLSSEEIAAMRKQLPASLKQEFEGRFDAYVRDAADLSTELVDHWLSWIARKEGVDLNHASIELSTCRLQYYNREPLWIPKASAFTREGRTKAEFAGLGYVATIRTGGRAYRYFLSTRDGSARLLPPGRSLEEWAKRNRQTAFGLAQVNGAAKGVFQPPVDATLLSRVVSRPLGQGRRDQLPQWLTPALRDHFEAAREEARGRTSADDMTDFLLDFIPFRSTVVAIQEGDFDRAKFLFFMDAVFFLLPSLSSVSVWKRGTGATMRSLGAWSRRVGDQLANRGLPGLSAALGHMPELRASIKAALQRMNETGAMVHGLRPLDARGMAQALRSDFPGLADALEQGIEREHGPAVHDGRWRVPAARAEESGAIEALRPIEATDANGNVLALQPYGGESRRAYTQFDPVTQERTGAVLTADGEGWLYQSLPADTLSRYRVREQEVLNALSVRQPALDGAITLHDRTYARIVDDYVEIAPEHAATVDLPTWRVISPRAARRDIVTHRLSYDRARALWRRAEMPGLKGGGGEAESSLAAGKSSGGEADSSLAAGRSRAGAGRDAGMEESGLLESGARGGARADNAFHQILVSRIAGRPTARQVDAVRELLARLETHPRASAILRAMKAYHELHNEAPEIVLLDRVDPARPRPLLEQPVRGKAWHLDLNALSAESLDSAAGEVAAVYNNMTGILEGEDVFAQVLARGKPEVDPALEQAWRRWAVVESAKADRAGRLAVVEDHIPRLKHDALVERLRYQLRQAQCFGGLDKDTFIGVLENRFEGEVPGLRLDLSEQDAVLNNAEAIVGGDGWSVTTIPPLPENTYALDVSDRIIRDWRNLPPNLKVLKASNTGGDRILRFLPPGLVELDISSNAITELRHNLPATLKRLNMDDNRLISLPRLPAGLQALSINDNGFLAHLPPEHIPPTLTVLRAAGNRLRVLPDLSGSRLEWLDVSRNGQFGSLPRLPQTLQTLRAVDCDLAELREALPRHLEELYLNDNQLTSLPDLPPRLRVLDLAGNRLEQLPASINELELCDIDLRDNPIRPEDVPIPADGRTGPRFTFSPVQVEADATDFSFALRREVQHWVRDPAAVARWEEIGRKFGRAADDANGAGSFAAWLDRLRETASYRRADFRASVEEWLIELSKPERESLLKSTLQMCVGATETCADRVALTLNDLRRLRLHDDIRLGRYNSRPAQAVEEMRQLFRLRKLQDIAYRKAVAMNYLDEEVEFYLEYTVGLRERLGLTTSVPAMNFSGVAGVTARDLDIAFEEVRQMERKHFYKDLVLDDTWNALIKQKPGDRYGKAVETLAGLADEPLQERIRAELVKRGLNPMDADAQRNIGPHIWREMRYEVLEPLTREYLESAGIAIPE